MYFSGKFSSKTSADQTPDALHQTPDLGVFLTGYCELRIRCLIPVIRCLIILIRRLIRTIRRLSFRQWFLALCQGLVRRLMIFIRRLDGPSDA